MTDRGRAVRVACGVAVAAALAVYGVYLCPPRLFRGRRLGQLRLCEHGARHLARPARRTDRRARALSPSRIHGRGLHAAGLRSRPAGRHARAVLPGRVSAAPGGRGRVFRVGDRTVPGEPACSRFCRSSWCISLDGGWGSPGGPRAGASAILAACPVFVFQAIQPMSDVVATFWVLAAVLCALLSRDDRRWALAAGFCFGAAVLVRPSNVLLARAPPVRAALGPAEPRRIRGRGDSVRRGLSRLQLPLLRQPVRDGVWNDRALGGAGLGERANARRRLLDMDVADPDARGLSRLARSAARSEDRCPGARPAGLVVRGSLRLLHFLRSAPTSGGTPASCFRGFPRCRSDFSCWSATSRGPGVRARGRGSSRRRRPSPSC